MKEILTDKNRHIEADRQVNESPRSRLACSSPTARVLYQASGKRCTVKEKHTIYYDISVIVFIDYFKFVFCVAKLRLQNISVYLGNSLNATLQRLVIKIEQ